MQAELGEDHGLTYLLLFSLQSGDKSQDEIPIPRNVRLFKLWEGLSHPLPLHVMTWGLLQRDHKTHLQLWGLCSSASFIWGDAGWREGRAGARGD